MNTINTNPLTSINQPSPQSPFPFFSLPAELREEIYAYAFGDNDFTDEVSVDEVRDHFPDPVLLCVCRQVYREALWYFRQARERFFRNKWILVGRSLKMSKGRGFW